MSLAVATPLFLAGLAAVAFPILAHLVRREEQMSMAFPSLMFLRRIPVREHRRRSIRHWWLLALRCSIIGLLCLGFAKPFIESPSEAAGLPGKGRDRVVLLDRSLSMQAGSRWNDALAMARGAVDELGAGDRVALITFDYEPLVVHELSEDHAAVRAALAGVRVTDGHTDLVGAISRAGALLDESTAGVREIVLISDFQRSGLDSRSRTHLPEGIVIEPRVVSGPVGTNAAIATAKLHREPLGDGDAVELTARIVNTGEQPIANTDLMLEVDGQDRERRVISLEPRRSRDETFRLVLAAEELLRVRIHIGEDGLDADNDHYLLVGGRTAIPVLLVRDSRAQSHAAPHLEEALRQGDDPGFRVTLRSVTQLRGSDFDTADVVVIDNAPIPAGEVGAKLRAFLESGGGLLMVAADRAKGSWPGGENGIMPGRLGPPVGRPEADAARILSMKTLHPALAGFAGAEGGNLASAQIFRYRRLTDVGERDVLARYDDANVAIAAREIGNGRVLVLTTTLDPSWNDLALQPGYLPLVHETLKYLSSHVTDPESVSVGDTVDLASYARGLPGYAQSAAALTRGALGTLHAPSGRTVHIPSGEGFARIREAGFHEIHVSGGGSRSLVVAANPVARESDLTALDANAFIRSIHIDEAGDASPRVVGARATGATVEHDLWWYLLLACAVLLALDTLISNRLSRSERPS